MLCDIELRKLMWAWSGVVHVDDDWEEERERMGALLSYVEAGLKDALL